LLVSDDCSTDGSAELLRRYAAKDNRIRCHIHSTNLGMVQHWNWCLSQARGEYVKFLFGDDKLANPQALSTLLGLLEGNPSAVLAASPRYQIDEDSKIIELWNDFGKPGLYKGSEVIHRCLRLVRNLIGEPSVVLFRKRDALRGFNVDYRQIVDEEMWLHLLTKGDFVFTSEPLCAFRKHEQQQTRINNEHHVGRKENPRLFLEHYNQPYAKRSDLRPCLFSQLYDLRKNLRRKAVPREPDIVEIHRLLTQQMGWWYGLYWLRRKTTKPFLNLARFVRGGSA